MKIKQAANEQSKIRTNPVDNKSLPFVKNLDEIFMGHEPSFMQRYLAKTIISIEIDQTEIRNIKLKKIKNHYYIEEWSEEQIALLSHNREEAILLALKNIIDPKTAAQSQIYLTVFGPEVAVRTITVPKLKGKELRDAIFWKTKNEIVNFSESAQWDYEIVEEVEQDKKIHYKVLTVIAQDVFIRKQLSILEEAGISPSRVMVKPVGLSASLKTLTNDWTFEGKNSVVIEVGRDSTHLLFFKNRTLEYVRTLSLGSNKIDKALNSPIRLKDKQIKLNPEKIDIFKRKHGIIIDLLNPSSKTYFPYNQLFKFMQPILQMFVSEIKRSFVFYQNSYEVDSIDVILLTGNGANLKNFDTFLERKFDVPVNSIAPAFPSILSGQYKSGYEFTTCFGTATCVSEKFNFLPKDIQNDNKYKKSQKTLNLAFVLLLLIIMVYSYFLYLDKGKFEEQVQVMTQRYEQLHPLEVKYNNLVKDIKLLQEKKNNIVNSLQTESKIIDVLKVFSNLTPGDVALSSIEYFEPGASALYDFDENLEGTVIVKGMVYKNFISADITLIEFITKLKELKYFKEIALEDKTKRLDEELFTFKIICKL